MKHLGKYMLATAFLGFAANALALDLSKPVTVVVPFGAGGLVDFATRVVMERAAQDLKATVVIDNRPGANAGIGTAAVVKARPDGQTLLATTGHIHIGPILDKNIGWKSKDLVPIARMTTSPSFMVVGPKSPFKSFNDLVAAAKGEKSLSFGTGGLGVSQTVAMGLLASEARLNILKVLYKSGPMLTPDVMSGVLDLSILPINYVLPLAKSGQLRPLATTSPQRLATLPDVPTFRELGFAQAEVNSWVGLHAPADTPSDVVQRLASAIERALADKEVQAKLEQGGVSPAFQTAEAFKVFLQEDARQAEKFGATLSEK